MAAITLHEVIFLTQPEQRCRNGSRIRPAWSKIAIPIVDIAAAELVICARGDCALSHTSFEAKAEAVTGDGGFFGPATEAAKLAAREQGGGAIKQ